MGFIYNKYELYLEKWNVSNYASVEIFRDMQLVALEWNIKRSSVTM